MSNLQEVFGDVISEYSRAQAIEDGVLVEVDHPVVREHYKFPLAMTASVWGIVERAVNNKRHCNDLAGVLHDMLHMSKVYFREVDEQTRIFRVIITGAGRKRNYDFKLHVGPGDNMEPVLTMSLPNED